jgi:Rad3-related DNA helicase
VDEPSALGLPYAAWRPGQRLAIRTAQYPRTSHTVINAPTGAGKSTVAAALPKLDPRARHVILTATKPLQDQYGEGFDFLVDLRGMSNYPCRAAKEELRAWFPRRRGVIGCDEGPCHAGVTCSLREEGCDYFDARRAFVASGSGLTNYDAWISNRRWGGAASPLGVADRLVCDEAHDLPDKLMTACAITVPYAIVDSRKTPRTIRGWKAWAENKLAELAPGSDDDQRLKRDRTERNLKQLQMIDRHWAWDRDARGFHFEPTVPRLLTHYLFDDVGNVIYLSATITAATLELLGIERRDITEQIIRSHFPVERRPIYVVPSVRVDFRTMKDPYVVGRWMDAIDAICEDRDDRRGIVHSVSFERGRQIYHASHARRRMILHHQGESATEAVRRFRKAGERAILVSPSVTTGFNFAYTDAEFQIVPKLPVPDTRSAIMRARIKATPRYREHATMTKLVQSCGRINRADDDQGETFIIDGHMSWWYRQHDDLAPEWFDEALVWTRKRVRPLPKLRKRDLAENGVSVGS